MAITSTDPIAPKEIIVPTLPYANQLSTAKTGSLAISGATLIVFDGTDWITAALG